MMRRELSFRQALGRFKADFLGLQRLPERRRFPLVLKTGLRSRIPNLVMKTGPRILQARKARWLDSWRSLRDERVYPVHA